MTPELERFEQPTPDAHRLSPQYLAPPIEEIPIHFRLGNTRQNTFVINWSEGKYNQTKLHFDAHYDISEYDAINHLQALAMCKELEDVHVEAALAYLMSRWIRRVVRMVDGPEGKPVPDGTIFECDTRNALHFEDDPQIREEIEDRYREFAEEARMERPVRPYDDE